MTARSPQVDRRLRRRGVALMMVVAVVAIASVLGYVMLCGATLQNQAGSNQAKLLSADYLAESGLNIAMYYLEHPEQAPALNAEGYWSGMNSDYMLPNGSPASLTVVVTRDASDPWTYEIGAIASVGGTGSGQQRVTRSNGARVYVRNEYVGRPGAGVANGDITFYGPITAFGDAYGSKQMAMKSGTATPVINGAGYSLTNVTTSGYSKPRDGYRPIDNSPAGAPIAPTNAELNRHQTYTYGEQQYTATILDDLISALTGVLGLITSEPTSDNPAGILYKQPATGTSFVLNDNVTIHGTLVVEGDLQIKGTNITITPQPGFPALIVTGNLEIFQSGKSLTANGLTYIGGQLKSNNNGMPAPLPSLASTFTVNGSLIFGSPTTAPIMTGYNAKTTLTYNADTAKAPELSSSLRRPKGVTIVRWGLP